MSDQKPTTPAGARQIQARVLKAVRVLPSEKPGVAALEMQTEKGSAYFLVSRETMLQIADHLRKNADQFQSSHPASGTAGQPKAG